MSLFQRGQDRVYSRTLSHSDGETAEGSTPIGGGGPTKSSRDTHRANARLKTGTRSGADRLVLSIAALLSAIGMVVVLSTVATAHDPDNESPARRWTCKGTTDCSGGTNWPHHTNADARWERWCCINPINDTAWVNATDSAASAWETGHTFDYVRVTNSQGSFVYTVAGDPCANGAWEGCASTPLSGDHIQEGSSYIQFRASTSLDKTDLATHEFGHLLGLGHSTQSSATMYSSVGSGADTLSTHDTRGRSQIYGNEHGWW